MALGDYGPLGLRVKENAAWVFAQESGIVIRLCLRTVVPHVPELFTKKQHVTLWSNVYSQRDGDLGHLGASAQPAALWD